MAMIQTQHNACPLHGPLLANVHGLYLGAHPGSGSLGCATPGGASGARTATSKCTDGSQRHALEVRCRDAGSDRIPSIS